MSEAPHAGERLSAYLDGELPAAEREQVESHLRECGPCARWLEELQAVDDFAQELPVAAPEGYFEAFPARVRERLAARRRRRVPAWTWAAAAAVLLAVVTPLTLIRREAAPAARRDAAAARVEAPPAGVEASAAPLPSATVSAQEYGRVARLPAPEQERANESKMRQAGREDAGQRPVLMVPPAGRDKDRLAARDADTRAADGYSVGGVSGGGGLDDQKKAKDEDARSRRATLDGSLAKTGTAAAGGAPARTFRPAEAQSTPSPAPPPAAAAPPAAPSAMAEEVVVQAEAPQMARREPRSQDAAKPDGAAAGEGAAVDQPRLKGEADALTKPGLAGRKEAEGVEGFRELSLRAADSAEQARALYRAWAAFARRHPRTHAGDEARVRSIESLAAAWRLGGLEADRQLARALGEAYVAEPGPQAARLRPLLEELSR